MKINSKRKSPVWPYLGILACLFVLSITAPRAWDRMGRQETLSPVSARKAAPAPVFRDQRSLVKENEIVDSTVTQAQTAAVDDEPLIVADTTGPIEPSPAAPQSDEQPAGPAVPPAAEIVQEVREDVEVANRPSLPAAEPTMVVPEPPAEEGVKPALDSSHWPRPRLLNEQLKQLAEADRSAAWATAALNLIDQLCLQDNEESAARTPILKELRKLADGNPPSAPGNARLETQIARTRYTLTRWLDIWEGAADLDKVPLAKIAPKASGERINLCLADVDSLARKGAPGEGWREYLKLESLRHLSQAGHSDQERREAARKILDRMTSTRLTKSQLKFAGEGPLAALHTHLRAWAAEPVTAAQLLAHLEQYEHSGLASDARLLAGDFRALSWSSPLEAEKISRHLDAHYRNANLRIAMTGALLNRMVPQPEQIVAPVRDTVINVPVYGSSTTSTKLSVRLVPDPNRIRLGLEGNGLVASDTVATSGPAKFRSQGRSNFLVRKLVVVGPHGMSVWPAVAEAENNYNYLMSVETDFDGVPLVGSLVRNVARSKHEQSQGEARMEVEQKVAHRARTELDEQVRPHLLKAAESIQQKEMALLDRLGLEVTPIEFSTTAERVVARVRLATPEQLGAHSPRPRAPSDCWYSLQVHESALNNVMEQLNLNGRKFELPELFAWVAKKLDRPQMAKLDDLPEDVHLTFAAEDAVRLSCEAGRLEVILSFAQLTQGHHHWHDFTVRTFYRPDRPGPRLNLCATVRSFSKVAA